MKNKFIKFLVVLITLMLFLPKAFAASNPYPKYQESPFGGKIVSCTWYVWQQAHDRMNVDLPLWTYVQTWYNKASKAGYSVGKTPKANSIMVWDYGEGFGGHAAYVTAVNGDTITFDEGGSPMTEDGIFIGNEFTMSDMSSFLVGFIYLDVPKKVEEKPASSNNNNTSTNTNTNKSEKPKPVIKSSDNNLSSLTIEGIEFEFISYKLEYQLEVEYNLNEITVNATANDSKATITGNGSYKLEVGENNLIVKVMAEDGSSKDYKLNIIRKEEVKELEELQEEETLDPKEEANENNKVTMIVVGISVVVILTLGFVIFKIKNRK